MRPSRRLALAGGLAAAAAACAGRPVRAVPDPSFRTLGRVERLSPAMDGIVAPDAVIQVLAEGFTWSEGPVWIAEGGYLLFSDVPNNRIHRWSEADGLSVFMEPSGYDGPATDAFREAGSNGLIVGPKGSILMADHGNRAVARLDLATQAKTLLATQFGGRRFSSPNDLVQGAGGAIFFTDPPYGLAGMDQSPLKEQGHNGVYRLDADGAVSLLVRDLTFPNGIGLSPDRRTLYVAVSDPAHAVVMAYGLDARGGVTDGRVLRDFTAMVGADNPGLPDGLVVDEAGRLFCTGPGGVHVLAPDGQALGLIRTDGPAANCTFGEDGRTLFITAGANLLRIRTLTRG